jgi:hypothetical protein
MGGIENIGVMTPAAQSFLGVFSLPHGLNGIWYGGFNLFVKIVLNYAFNCVKIH